MNAFLRFAAYLFHPLLMPLLGVIIFYKVTPRYIEPEIIKAKIVAIIIVTILIPIITFFLLKNLQILTHITLKNVKERKFPLMIQTLLLLLVIKMVFSAYDSPELYFFFCWHPVFYYCSTCIGSFKIQSKSSSNGNFWSYTISNCT